MKTFAEVVVADRTPLYTYVPIARAGVECLALAHWLSEPGIGVRERVRRSINERIASAYEQSRLPLGLNPEPDRQARLLQAVAVGFVRTQARKGQLTVLAPRRPTITWHVQRVLGDSDLGQVVYSYFSAISHGTIWGLVERAEVPPERRGPVVSAALTISSGNIAMAAAALVFAHMTAYGGYMKHMGWTSDEWSAAAADALRIIGRYVSSGSPSGSQAALAPPAQTVLRIPS